MNSSILPNPRLVAELNAQFAESAKLEQAIKANLRGLGYD
jgi:type I restriction enzyme M protein